MLYIIEMNFDRASSEAEELLILVQVLAYFSTSHLLILIQTRISISQRGYYNNPVPAYFSTSHLLILVQTRISISRLWTIVSQLWTIISQLWTIISRLWTIVSWLDYF